MTGITLNLFLASIEAAQPKDSASGQDAATPYIVTLKLEAAPLELKTLMSLVSNKGFLTVHADPTGDMGFVVTA